MRRSMPREKEYSPLREALYCPLLAPTNMFFSYGPEKARLPTPSGVGNDAVRFTK